MNYYTKKYGPLCIGLGILIMTILPIFLMDEFELNFVFILITFLQLAVAVLSFYIFDQLKSKWRIVALNRLSIVVDENSTTTEYSWLDVESIELNSFLGFYTLKIKNREEILFPAYGLTNILTGDQSEMGTIISKMKRHLGLS